MVKVRTSQIPGENGKVKIVKKVRNRKPLIEDIDPEDEEFVNTLPSHEDDDEDDGKKIFKPMVFFPEEGLNLSLYGIESIEKDFKILESNYGGDEVKIQYGIVINKGMEPSLRYPKTNVEIWFNTEELRDQRYKRMMDKLEECGFVFITA